MFLSSWGSVLSTGELNDPQAGLFLPSCDKIQSVGLATVNNDRRIGSKAINVKHIGILGKSFGSALRWEGKYHSATSQLAFLNTDYSRKSRDPQTTFHLKFSYFQKELTFTYRRSLNKDTQTVIVAGHHLDLFPGVRKGLQNPR